MHLSLKMYKQIETMIRDQIVKRCPEMKGLVKAEVHGITEGFKMEDAISGRGALIDYDILIRHKRNQGYEIALEEWEKALVNYLLYNSFGQRTLAIYINNKEIRVG